MQIVRVPGFGLSYDRAEYYGRRHCVHVGWWLIFWSQMTEAELQDWYDRGSP